ncbi:MAG: bacillithiol biosynthesis BshC [Bacteroidetes bacterium]|nr:bacillithiol biosynthesis BshC [Bacteroidota bacterium]
MLVQLKKLKRKLFPRDGLQERTDNFIPFYILWKDIFWMRYLNKPIHLQKNL